MSTIIQKWLMKRLGFITNLTPESIAELSKDGRLIAEVLYNYNVITCDQFLLVKPADDVNNALNNLVNYIAVWLRLLGIESTYETLLNIANGKGNAAIRLFYQLYLRFQDKDTIHFIKERANKECLNPPNSKFDVKPVKTPTEKPNFLENSCHEFLNAKRDVIEWRKQHYKTLLENCQRIREQYIKQLQEQCYTTYPVNANEKEQEQYIGKVVEEVRLDSNVPENCTYDKLINEQKCIREIETLEPKFSDGDKYIQQLKEKRRQKANENAQKIQTQKLLLMEMWQNLMNQEDQQFENIVSQKMAKQSTFEKQMATKILQVRHQKEVIMNNKQVIDNAILKQHDEEIVDSVFFREKSASDQKRNYYSECNRTLELHKRLYAKKKQLKQERHYKMCRDVVNDIVNLTLKHAEFKRVHKRDVPPRLQYEWNNLFIKEKPIFRALHHVEDIAQEYLEDLPTEIEELYISEIDRQNALDDKTFEDYCCFTGPYDLKVYDLYDEQDLYAIDMGLNVLGYIVHKVLFAKYPRKKMQSLASIPEVNVAACVNGILDETVTPVLQVLLQEKGIKLIEIQDAINHCLEAYKAETTMEYVDNVLVSETEKAADDLQMKGKNKAKKAKEAPKKGNKKNKKNQKSTNMEESAQNMQLTVNEYCQTPRIFPCEEIVLTVAAEIGKEAYELLGLGQPLPDELVTSAFVEYLKTLKEIKGWVLINYPVTLDQVVNLEEALSGKPIPDIQEPAVSIDDLADLNHRSLHNDDENNLRQSKILPNPRPHLYDDCYETFLTAYINIKQNMMEDETDDIQRLKDLEGTNSVEKFYSLCGCNYTLYYKVFDFATIKHLGKLIIGEFSIPPKASLELFGDTVLYLQTSLEGSTNKPGRESKSIKTGEKKKPKSKKKDLPKDNDDEPETTKKAGSKKEKNAKNKKKKATPAPEVVIVRENKATQMPDTEDEETETVSEPPPPPKPGEEEWTYVDVQIPSEFEIVLATLWENAEETYVTDMKQLFFVNRVIRNAIVVYITYVSDNMQYFIQRPDFKQIHLFKFQKAYNEIDSDMRNDQELKSEIHCRIVEFREKLWKICDARMKEAEQERLRIIEENWMTNQICEVTNNSINRFQLEINRFADTLQFITDYYTACITKVPSEQKFEKKCLVKLESQESSKATSEMVQTIERLLREMDSVTESTSYHDCITQNYNTAINYVKQLSSSSTNYWEQLKHILAPSLEGKVSKTSKKGKDNKRFWEPEPDVKESAEKIVEEWKCALSGEILRVNLRLNLLKAVAEKELDSVLTCGQKAFHGICDSIDKRYKREIQSVQSACEVIARAVEAEVPLQPQLVLDDDAFFIDPGVILFPADMMSLPNDLVDASKTDVNYFTLPQLNSLCDLLWNIAPSGNISERSLIFFLQDIITLNAEDGSGSLVPPLWKRLNSNQVSQTVVNLFGNTEYVNWKDFIIYNLSVRFPSEEELMHIRAQFRENDPDVTECVNDYQFSNIKFWFEKDFSDQHTQETDFIDAIKHLLFKIFRTDNGSVNYTALLLAFCKDLEPVVGVSKALELSSGKYVCWQTEIGESFVLEVLERRVIDEEQRIREEHEHNQTLLAAQNILTEAADEAIHMCDSIVITEYVSDENVLQSKYLKNSANTLTGIGKAIKSAEALEANTACEQNTDMVCSNILCNQSLFSNISVNYESTSCPPKMYFLPFETLLIIMTAALPWNSTTQSICGKSLREHLEVLYIKCKRSEFNGAVLAHEFLNHPDFKSIFEITYKFTVKCPVQIVENVLKGE